MNMNDIKLRTKLITLLSVLGIVMLVITGYHVHRLYSVNEAYHIIFRDDVSASTDAAALGMHFNGARVAYMQALQSSDPSVRQASMTDMQQADKDVQASLESLQKKAVTPEARAEMQKLAGKISENNRARHAALDTYGTDNQLVEAERNSSNELGSELSKLAELTKKSSDNNINNLVGSIHSSMTMSIEQKLALDQINQGVLQVSQVVQSNSATSEEAAAASEELSAQADRLKGAAAKFKLGDNAVEHTFNRKMSNIDTQHMRREDGNEIMKPAVGQSDSSMRQTASAAGTGRKPSKIALTEEEGFGKY